MKPNSKNDAYPEQFLTRSERIKNLVFPQNSSTLLIVKPNAQALGFKFNCYDDELLRDRVERSRFLLTIKEANKIVEAVWKLRKKEEDAEYQPLLKWILYLAIVLSLASFIFLFILVEDTTNEVQDELLITSIVCIILAGILTAIVVIKSLFSHPRFIDFERTVMMKLNSYFDTQNNVFYLKRSLEWRVEPKFYWLELHILRGHSSSTNQKETNSSNNPHNVNPTVRNTPSSEHKGDEHVRLNLEMVPTVTEGVINEQKFTS